MRNIVSLLPGVSRFGFSRFGVRQLAPVAIFSLAVLSPVVMGVAITGLFASAIVVPAKPAHAETKVFFVENQPDGYGIDQCLATGAKCGKSMASAYCQARQYGEAVSYRKADPEEMPKEAGDAACSANGCVDFVAIECQR